MGYFKWFSNCVTATEFLLKQPKFSNEPNIDVVSYFIIIIFFLPTKDNVVISAVRQISIIIFAKTFAIPVLKLEKLKIKLTTTQSMHSCLAFKKNSSREMINEFRSWKNRRKLY